MAVLTSMDRVHEFINRLNSAVNETDGYEWVNWSYFITRAVYILLYDAFLKIITQEGIYLEAEISRHGASVKVGSISECYCGDCNCGE